MVINDLIFDSTQAYAMKLCRESLDWICEDMGFDVIDVALRLNRGHGTKKKLRMQNIGDYGTNSYICTYTFENLERNKNK